MRKIWYNIRVWLINKLVGNDIRVVANAHFGPGSQLKFMPGDYVIRGCHVHGE